VLPKKKIEVMKITAISDTHTKHAELALPGGDVLIHAGDFMSSGYSKHEIYAFLDWISIQKYNHIILIAGNHERLFESSPELCKEILDGYPNVTYLQDGGCVIDGFSFYGSPWTPAFCNWAFQSNGVLDDTQIYQKIPKNTDILITHGPAYGLLDQYKMPNGQLSDHLGSKELTKWINANNPKLHICGHIHSGQGVLNEYGEGATHINASCLGEDYKYSNKNKYIEWEL